MGYAIILFLAIALTTLAALYSFKTGVVHFIIAKKVLHILAISIAAVSVVLVENEILLYIVGATLPLVFWMVYKGYFNDKKKQIRNSWGVFYFVAVFFVLLLIFPDEPQYIFYPLIVLALADGVATLVGYFYGKHPIVFRKETKSWEGSIAFFLAALISFWLIPRIIPSIDPVFSSIWSLLFVSIFLSALEAISIDGRDNIWIPFGVLYWILVDTSLIDGFSILIAISISVIAFLTFKMKWLSADGAIATALLGSILMISPYPEWVIPALVFFIFGSLFSFLPGKNGSSIHEPRNSFQVFCNGGVYTVLTVLFFITSNFVFLVGGLAALATSMSDTASSEFGVRYGKKTYNILTFKSIKAGVSGGISIAGTAAGVFFLSLFCFIPFLITADYTPKVFLIVFLSGFFGNAIDSYLGAFYQVKYRPSSLAQWSDSPMESVDQEMRGYPFITNDIVNILSTIFASFLAIFLCNVL